jgi:hypothetical protein
MMMMMMMNDDLIELEQAVYGLGPVWIHARLLLQQKLRGCPT